MGIIDNTFAGLIAVFYNVFVHHIASMIYKDLPYSEKIKYISTFLIIMGIVGIVVGKIILKDNQKYKDSVVSKGLGFGGIILILTSIFSNWENINDDKKLIITALSLGALIYIAHKVFDSSPNNKSEKKSKKSKKISNEELDELLG